jgi:hypothetical protein
MKNFIPHRSKIVVGIAALVVTLGLAAGIASAQSPHYIRLTTSIDSATACYTVNLKEAGLGNDITSVTYTISCDATFTDVCVTRNGKNFVQGQPKSGSTEAASQTTLQARNGQTNGTIDVCPSDVTLPDPGCTGSQKLYIIAASYTNCTIDDGLGTNGAGIQDLADHSVSNVLIQP